jgi:DNA-binding NtrC family response regulator
MTETAPTVMIVDDEEMITTALQNLLSLVTDYRVLTYTSPLIALEAIDSGEPVSVLVSDFMMPGMDGITFLTAVREKRPTATRILLTGYAEKGNAIQGINEAGLYFYLEKPWDNDQVRVILRNAVERSTLLCELDARLGALEDANQELARIRQRLIRALL